MPYNTFQNSYQPYYPQYPQYQQQYNQQQYSQQSVYSPQIQQQQQQMVNSPQIQNQAVISPKFDVVQGELAANMYEILNGQEVILIDRDNPFVYKRRRTPDGKLEPLEKYKLAKVEEQEKPEIDFNGFVRKEDIELIVENAVRNEMEKKLSEITLKPSTRKKSEE